MLIERLDIDYRLKDYLRTRGITKLYPPQEEAVRKGIFKGKNILMVTQTASGKTFLAELLAVNNALMGRGKTVYLTPLKALATEKHTDFKKYVRLGIRTGISLGNYDKSDTFLEAFDIIITTYEKMDSLLRHNPSWFRMVKTIVVDEIHYLDDPERGPVIESIISRIKTHRRDIQIVSLSATVGNPEEIANWLGAELVESTWRPVPLKEGVYLNGRIIFNDGTKTSVVRYFSNPLLDLVKNTLDNDGQCLVFVNSRRRAVTLAEKASKLLSLRPTIESRELAAQVSELSDVESLNLLLKELIEKRASFHHAGLTVEQRKAIEEGFRKGVIKVIFSTPTLAAGVNLPARRVVVEDYRRYSYQEGMNMIKVIEYKQFAGRAGRPGLDEYGEAVLIARSEAEAEKLTNVYIKGEPEDVESSFHTMRSLRTHLLAYIASMGIVAESEISSFIKNTLAHMQFENKTQARLRTALSFLIKSRFIVEEDGKFKATQLGQRVSEVYIDPASALVLLRGASKKTKRYSDFGLLHLITAAPDMILLPVRRKELEELDRLLDVYIPDMLLGFEDIEHSDYDRIYQELKTSLLLLDWVNEESEETIIERYDIGPGDLRNIVETAEWIAYSFRRILETTGINSEMVPLYARLEQQIRYGVKPELLELVRIPGIGRVRARRLYNAGYKSIDDIASASVTELSNINGIGRQLAAKLVETAKLIKNIT